jgi:endonuclease YncB( thermonuclease family)
MFTLTRFVAGVVTPAVVPACSVIASSVAHADPVTTTATVLKVVDGDIDIVDDVRGRLRIRLLGIDTSETKKPGYTSLAHAGEAMTTAAVSYAYDKIDQARTELTAVSE